MDDGATRRVSGAVDAALADDLGCPSPAKLLAQLGEVARVRNRLAVLDSRLIAEVEFRRLDGDLGGTRTTAELLGQVQPLTPHAASQRVDVALSTTERRSLTGQKLQRITTLVRKPVRAPR